MTGTAKPAARQGDTRPCAARRSGDRRPPRPHRARASVAGRLADAPRAPAVESRAHRSCHAAQAGSTVRPQLREGRRPRARLLGAFRTGTVWMCFLFSIFLTAPRQPGARDPRQTHVLEKPPRPSRGQFGPGIWPGSAAAGPAGARSSSGGQAGGARFLQSAGGRGPGSAMRQSRRSLHKHSYDLTLNDVIVI